MYSTGHNPPPQSDANNVYATTFQVNADNSVWFTSTRPPTPPAGYDETYVI